MPKNTSRHTRARRTARERRKDDAQRKGDTIRRGDPSPYRAGIVVVHGVGNQRAGATVEHVAGRIESTLRELDMPAKLGSAPSDGGPARTKQIDMSGARPVLVAEAHWSDIVRDTREKGWRPALARVWFIVAMFPYLLSAALAPRAHEMKKIAARFTAKRRTERLPIDSDLEDLVDQAPTMWRGITVITVVLGVVLAFTAWPIWLVLLAVCVAAGLLLLFTRSPWDVVEHVRMAGLGREQLAAVLARVGATLDEVAKRCDAVWVIGHSQGGYIAHRLLSENGVSRWPSIRRFTGVASGVRPIRLIAAVSNPRWIVAGWLWMSAVVMSTIGVMLMFEPGGPFNSDGLRSLMTAAVLMFAHGPAVLLDPPRTAALVDFAGSAGAMLMPTQWWWLLLLAAGLVLMIAAARLQRRGGASLERIPPLPKRIRWEEVTSPSDVVGSMSVPELSGDVTERVMPSLRQPVLDHLLTSYLGRRSMFRFEIAQWLARTGDPATPRTDARPFDGLSACTSDLNDLAERTYRLRMSVQLIFLVFAVVLPAALGASLLTAASSVLYAGVALAAVTAVIAGTWWTIASRRRVDRFIRESTTGSAPSAASDEERRAVRGQRSTWSARIVTLAALVAALGGWGCYLLAAVQESTGFAALRPVTIAMRGAGITLIGVVPLLLIAFCASVVGLRGVRAILGVCIVVLMNGIGLLRLAGEPWSGQGRPGLMPLIVTGAIVVAALLWSRPRPSSRLTARYTRHRRGGSCR